MLLFAAMLIGPLPMLPAQPVIANPASTYCLKIGGRLEFVSTAEGQMGFCILPNGERIEEWTLFRRDMERQKANDKN